MHVYYLTYGINSSRPFRARRIFEDDEEGGEDEDSAPSFPSLRHTRRLNRTGSSPPSPPKSGPKPGTTALPASKLLPSALLHKLSLTYGLLRCSFIDEPV